MSRALAAVRPAAKPRPPSPTPLYLASVSPRRRLLIKQLGRPVRIVRSTYVEHDTGREDAETLVRRHAVGKARQARLPRGARRGIVLGADTCLWFRGRVINKPADLNDARRMLRELSGRSHWVYTGVCLIDVASGRERVSVTRSRVTFHWIDDAAISRLFRRYSPLDKAGAYAVQEDTGELIARIRGSVTNVIGLPMERVRRELRALEAADQAHRFKKA